LEIFNFFDLNPIPLNQKIENNFYFPQAARSDFGPKSPWQPSLFLFFSFCFFSKIGLPSAPGPLNLSAQPRPAPLFSFSAQPIAFSACCHCCRCFPLYALAIVMGSSSTFSGSIPVL
jgi:hypothetical protein